MTRYNDGILLYYKPTGITSNNAIQKIKKDTKISKIGHAGTLDKFAEGLLLVLIGKATKLSLYLMELEKEYLSTIHFGKETDTLDRDGTVIKNAPIPSKTVIRSELEKISGIITHTPPAYSAIHIQGSRASDLARKKVFPRMPSKTITIYENTLLEYDLPDILVRWKVSKGTYIRSLAKMLGEHCNSCAYLTKLVRTKIGNFSINQIAQDDQASLHKGFIPLLQLLTILDNALQINTRDDSIREKLREGIQPLALLSQHRTQNTKLLYLCDQHGLVGVWKMDTTQKNNPCPYCIDKITVNSL